MRIFLIWFLTIISFGTGAYVFFNGGNGMSFGLLWVIAFIHPLTMLLLNIQLHVMPKMRKIKVYYLRYKKGFENIFLALTFVLLIIHINVILKVFGYDINLLQLVPICVGLVLITTANTLPRFVVEKGDKQKISVLWSNYWNSVIRPISVLLFIGGIAIFLTVFLPDANMIFGFFVVLSVVIACMIYQSSKIIQRVINGNEG
ncbi:hypothetical protein CR203_10170 [Salipaludibacillus neizhouensis]|uniref:Uncharacterized protein n=1 Tax=Salipaludibacillus neizhouensis TaxID=885475 RepID=A0A3A9K3Q1_9BACI|nr:hypothetical protein [Salipaludibacillus neizhouensis]RKL67704.1 hypothetical protein CR203_10170 [Salipaludibacillus neizhouensis]